MATITETMTNDHRRCDHIFAEAEGFVAKSDWEDGRARFQEFYQAMEHHFSMEEDVLFPEFENASGMSSGPTQVMRMEHKQMRQLLLDMEQAVERRDSDGFLGMSETLMIIMQQHNVKEEQMLYPMSDNALVGDAERVIARMESI